MTVAGKLRYALIGQSVDAALGDDLKVDICLQCTAKTRRRECAALDRLELLFVMPLGDTARGRTGDWIGWLDGIPTDRRAATLTASTRREHATHLESTRPRSGFASVS